jgi:DUF2075 family protein
MYKVKVNKESAKTDSLINPIDMLTRQNENCCFQQYSHGKPQKTFYINCGIGEDSLITIWYNDESKSYLLSTDNIESLSEFNSHVKVKKIKSIELEFTVK